MIFLREVRQYMNKGLLDPKVDFVFENIFGSAKHLEIMK